VEDPILIGDELTSKSKKEYSLKIVVCTYNKPKLFSTLFVIYLYLILILDKEKKRNLYNL